jgi:hypothetical protein
MRLDFSPRARWAGLALGWIGVTAALAVTLQRTPVSLLRVRLSEWQFWALELQFLLVAGLTAANYRSIERALRPVPIWSPALVGAAMLALVLSAGVAPRTSRIFFDEQIYQHIGQNLSDLRLAQMCNEGSVEYGILRCALGEYNKQPYGYPHALSLLYRVFGVDERLAFWFNNLCAAGLVAIVFWTTALLFRDRRAAAFAALVAAMIPELLRWSNSAAVEPSAALACAFAMMTAVHFVRTRSSTGLVWVMAAAVLAAQFRPESLLIVPLVGLVIVLFAPGELGTWRFWTVALAGFVLCMPLVAHFVAVGGDPWGASGPRTSLSYVVPNLAVNGPFYYADWRFPALYSVLAVIGLVWTASVRAAALVLVNFAVFWLPFLFFYAGSYNYGADVRYSLMTYAPLAILAGVGASRLAAALEERAPVRRVDAGMALVMGFFFLPYLPYVRAVGEEAWAARADVEYARQVVDAVPKDGLVLTHTPSMFLVWGTNAAQMSLATSNPDYVRNQLLTRYQGGVYLHWGFWCNVDDEVQVGFCKTALSEFRHELVGERTRWANRYALYRLVGDPSTP